MRRNKQHLARQTRGGLAVAAAAILLGAGLATADTISSDGDSLSEDNGNNATLANATDCATGKTFTGSAVVNYAGSTHFNNGSTVTVSSQRSTEATAAGLTVGGADSKTVMGWDSSTDRMLFTTSVTVPAGTPDGTYEIVVVATGDATKYTGGGTEAVPGWTIRNPYNVTVACDQFEGGGGGTANAAPTVSAISGSSTAAEGSSGAYSVTASDPDNDTLGYAWSVTSGNASIPGPTNGSSVSVSFTDGPSSVGLQVVVSDGQGHEVTRSTTVSETNVAPDITGFSLTGASGTACQGVTNKVTMSFSVTDAVSDAVDPITGTISWGDGSSTPITGRSISEEHLYTAGSWTASVSVNDGDDSDTAGGAGAGAVSLLYRMSGLQAPINADGSSIFKYGSTVPVKVKITDCSGAPVPGLAPTLAITRTSATEPPNTVNEEAVSTSSADTGTTLRWDGVSQYIYNLNTKGSLTPDSTATYTAKVSQSVSSPSPVSSTFGLKLK